MADVPMMRLANLSFSLGISGTDATKTACKCNLFSKKAADMIVLDDQLKTVVDAFAEGEISFIYCLQVARKKSHKCIVQ